MLLVSNFNPYIFTSNNISGIFFFSFDTGLSASIFSAIYNQFGESRLPDFLLFLAIALASVGVLCSICLRYITGYQKDIEPPRHSTMSTTAPGTPKTPRTPSKTGIYYIYTSYLHTLIVVFIHEQSRLRCVL